jgi:hypothetical protein
LSFDPFDADPWILRGRRGLIAALREIRALRCRRKRRMRWARERN